MSSHLLTTRIAADAMLFRRESPITAARRVARAARRFVRRTPAQRLPLPEETLRVAVASVRAEVRLMLHQRHKPIARPMLWRYLAALRRLKHTKGIEV